MYIYLYNIMLNLMLYYISYICHPLTVYFSRSFKFHTRMIRMLMVSCCHDSLHFQRLQRQQHVSTVCSISFDSGPIRDHWLAIVRFSENQFRGSTLHQIPEKICGEHEHWSSGLGHARAEPWAMQSPLPRKEKKVLCWQCLSNMGTSLRPKPNNPNGCLNDPIIPNRPESGCTETRRCDAAVNASAGVGRSFHKDNGCLFKIVELQRENLSEVNRQAESGTMSTMMNISCTS